MTGPNSRLLLFSEACPPPLARLLRVVLLSVALLPVTGGCVAQAAPEPAVQRTGPPPWDAPVDAVSTMRVAGLEPQPLGLAQDAHVFVLTVRVDGRPVVVPRYLGTDRKRALHAVVRTHDDSGQVWVAARRPSPSGSSSPCGVCGSRTALSGAPAGVWSSGVPTRGTRPPSGWREPRGWTSRSAEPATHRAPGRTGSSAG